MVLRNPSSHLSSWKHPLQTKGRSYRVLTIIDLRHHSTSARESFYQCDRKGRRLGLVALNAAKIQPLRFKSSANRLSNEQSPELLKYAKNEIGWYPWGEEAIEKAQKEQKLIFLSIGYLSNHWCELMKKESFEDPEIAEFINENYIPVKVDREERPDLDRWCSTFVHLSLEKTGWPTTMFLTPDLGPVFGSAYLPKVQKYGLPEFKTVLRDILHEWNTDKEKIIVESDHAAKTLTTAFMKEPLSFEQGFGEGITLVDELMDECANYLIQHYDEDYGGFGEKDKFLNVSYLNLIMQQFHRKMETTENDAVAYLMKMIIFTLGGIYDGGIRDHIGGGLHRYTIDQIWHVPEFEKILLDNAAITRAFLSTAQMFPDATWSEMARETLDCLKRDFLSPEGGFYTSIGADSVDNNTGENKEGAYYTWDAKEIKSLLSEKDYQVFSRYYSIMDDGNCNLAKAKEEEPIFTNILAINDSWEVVSKEAGLTRKQFFALIAKCRKILYQARIETRAKPIRDEKIICGWNGMAISAFAKASKILPHEVRPFTSEAFPVEGCEPSEYLSIAIRSAEFIINKLWKEDEEVQHLMRYYFNGNCSTIAAFAEDYAHVIDGFLDLYSCCGDLKWLQWALKLQDRMDSLFWDDHSAGYFSSTADNQSLKTRTKMYFDTEEPCAASVAVSNLLRLSGIVSRGTHLREKAIKIVQTFAAFAQENASSLPELAASSCLVDLHPSLLKVIVVGDPENQKSQEFIAAMHRSYAIGKSLIFINPEDQDNIEFWRETAPEIVERFEGYWNPKIALENEIEGEIQFPLLFICDKYEFSGPYDEPNILISYMKSESTTY